MLVIVLTILDGQGPTFSEECDGDSLDRGKWVTEWEERGKASLLEPPFPLVSTSRRVSRLWQGLQVETALSNEGSAAVASAE